MWIQVKVNAFQFRRHLASRWLEFFFLPSLKYEALKVKGIAAPRVSTYAFKNAYSSNFLPCIGHKLVVWWVSCDTEK